MLADKKHWFSLVSSVALFLDFLMDWGSFGQCPKHFHRWVLSSYFMIALSRVWVLAHKRFLPTAAYGAFLERYETSICWTGSWTALKVLLVGWSSFGAKYLWEVYSESPENLPSQVHLLVILLWQVLTFVWVTGICWLQSTLLLWWAREDFRHLQDADMVGRWGAGADLGVQASLGAWGAGLRAKDILALPGLHTAGAGQQEEGEHFCADECTICLLGFQDGEQLRRLGCGHVFHRACVDMWLFRSACCPLCKAEVPGGAGGGAGEGEATAASPVGGSVAHFSSRGREHSARSRAQR